MGCALIAVALLASAASGQNWRPTITFPDDPFRVIGNTPANPDWVKCTIKLADPNTVYWQNCNVYGLHWEFATAELPGYIGISRDDFNLISLYAEGQELALGAVLMPASGTWPPPQIPEYGIQLIRSDPYPREEIVYYFNLIKNTVIAEPNVQAFYFPTYEQWEVAQQNAEWLASQGVIVSSSSRWATGNAIYSQGWALGELKYFEGDQIAEAYLSGALCPGDIVLTDGVPAEMPILAGILTLTPSTPNSHVVILANDYSVPFVHLAVPADAQLAQALVGHRIVLRAYETYNGSQVRLIDVEGVLTDAQIEDILQLKVLPPLEIQPIEPFGAYSQNAVEMVLEDMPYFGGKASNYGFLKRTIPDNNPTALGLSFDVWNEFMDQVLANGNTLREEISQRLDGYTWPPNMQQLADDLGYVRDLIENKNHDLPTIIPPDVEAGILEIFQDPQYGFIPDQKIRFRNSTNVEDSDQFTGAGLYESYSGCLADDLDGDTHGPSWCDPNDTSERGVFRAIRKVYSSFYFDNAFLERLRRSVDPNEVGMAMLVHHSFPDQFELANGVGTYDRSASNNASVYLVTQLGAVSVTNPEGGATPEEVRVDISPWGTYAYVLRYSSLMQLGETMMVFPDDYVQLAGLMQAVANEYAAAIGEEAFLLDYEYKKLLPGGAAMPQGGFDVDQVRKIPSPLHIRSRRS